MKSENAALFRPAKAADVDAITRLVRDAYAKWVPVIGREPLPMTVDYAAAEKEHDIDLAFAGDTLVGLIETMARADHLWIENVAVAPAQQGRGYGVGLLAHAEETARASGLAEIRLLTNEAFASNVGLYLKVGYVIDRTEPFRGGTTVYMSKRIA